MLLKIPKVKLDLSPSLTPVLRQDVKNKISDAKQTCMQGRIADLDKLKSCCSFYYLEVFLIRESNEMLIERSMGLP